MEDASKISLIDLSKQLQFEIDDAIKKDICFGETLIISCGHFEGEIGGEDSNTDECPSEDESAQSKGSDEVKDDTMFEYGVKVEEEVEPEEELEETDDFHFYFFPDCKKPLPLQDSKASLIIVDGIPQTNFEVKDKIFCTCKKDRKGTCECFVKLPCLCGAKTKAECDCSKLEGICICQPGQPKTECTCKGSKACYCFPDGPKPVCVCGEVEKPCLCFEGTKIFPEPVCTCKYKPKFIKELNSIGEDGEQMVEEAGENKEEGEGEEEEEEEKGHEKQFKKREPCVCQKVEKKIPCQCRRGKDCTCDGQACICGVQKFCTCEPMPDQEETICKSDDSKTVCTCGKPRKCSCEGGTLDCECFPKDICTCEKTDDCKCFSVCDCTEPCVCDTAPVEKPLICTCLDKAKQDGTEMVCTCDDKHETPKKLKKVKAGREGYRWCHDVDPKHTYFDYAYDRHDKVSYKKQEEEKFKILGLYDKKEEDACPVHGNDEGNQPPAFEKKVRKPSIDCCSAVGGISFSVETLGEDKDKFLVQVVSHSSKEGAKCGTKLVSILDSALHTMEENRTEHITKKTLTKEQRSYIAICENGYYNKVTRICGDRTVIKRHYHSFEDARKFLLEGANVVLLRYFALIRYRGKVRTETLMMNGSICESIYVCNGVSQAIVNGKFMFVVKVERHIIEPSGYIHQTLTVLTLKGYIISHEWADNNYLFHINPLLEVVPEENDIEIHAPLRERWREDLQLLSDYLDYKTTRTSEGGRYVTENGALTATVRDYLQALLLLRPHDALHFTRHYFSAALSALDLPHDEYFEPTHKRVRYYFFEE